MKAAVARAAEPSGDVPNADDAAGATVMVVEDYDELRFVVSLALKMSGYRVIEATNGQEAIEMAQREHPDLILMDMNLPIVDGFTATRRIREQAATSDVPIIAVTAYGTPDYRHRALAAGCDEFITKPIDLNQLERKLHTILAHKLNG